MREIDSLDALLDSALGSYADPGPDSGLEARVLNRLSEVRAARRGRRGLTAFRRGWFPFAIAIPAAACFLVVWLHHPVTVRNSAAQIQAPPAARGTQQPSQLHAPSPTMTFRAASAHRTAVSTSSLPQDAHVSPLPKLDVFPTPQPLTPEEQALAVVAKQTPRPELQALIEAQKQEEIPFPVAVAHIPPLEPPASGDNNR